MIVAFACTGNTCRSPMAEGFFNVRSKANRAVSFGLVASIGLEPSTQAVMAMEEVGIDIRNKRSNGLGVLETEDIDLILTMTKSHRDRLRSMGYENTYTLNEYACGKDKDVEDPFGGTIEDYRQARDEIEKLVDIVIEKLEA